MTNQVKLEFAGDAAKLAKASKDAAGAIDGVATASKDASAQFTESTKSSTGFLDKIGKLGAGVSGFSDAVDSATGLLDDFNQIQNASYERSQRQARALVDVQQAQEDLNQALRDGKQAAIDADQAGVDLQQAQLDQATAARDYAAAVKQYGRDSLQARQAQLDLKQAGVDVKQAQEDSSQALRDGSQATIDAKNAQLDLNDAQREAHPPALAQWAQDIEQYAPLLQGLIGVTGLVTAAQWAWNVAQLASPLTWIILGIVALVAAIVLIATKTDWFQRAWRASWGWVKSAAASAWDFIKKIPGWIGSAFSSVARFIFEPFRAAFNLIADAWNYTIGRLSWTVPGWVPYVGGNTISVPNLPHFHAGGVVPGGVADETLAVLRGGERVSMSSGGGQPIAVHVPRGALVSVSYLVDVLSKEISRRGGNVQFVLGS